MVFLVLSLGPSLALAEARWAPQQERRAFLTALANRHGFAVGTASAHTTARLNERLHTRAPLSASNVRITDYETWGRLAHDLKAHVIGGAATPHMGGPHLYLVAGEWLADSIDRTVGDRFYDTGTKARRQFLGNGYHFPRIFLLWAAPVESLTLVGQESERIVRERAADGYNCAVLMAKTLGKEGQAHSSSPFAGQMSLQHLVQPVTHHALNGVGEIGPDLVVQVLRGEDFHQVQQNWPGHEIQFWY